MPVRDASSVVDARAANSASSSVRERSALPLRRSARRTAASRLAEQKITVVPGATY